MAKEIEAEYAKRLNARSGPSDNASKELSDLDARIARLKARLAARIKTWSQMRFSLPSIGRRTRDVSYSAPLASAAKSALILSILSKAAAMYTKKIEEGLSGDPKLRLWPG